MKRTLLLLALLPTVLGIAAQDYKPMLVNGREWFIIHTSLYYDYYSPGAYKYSRTVIVVGDSIIGDLHGKKLYSACDDPDESINYNKYIWLYDDVQNKKILSFSGVSNTFNTFLDYSLTDWDENHNAKVVSDSILVKGKKYHRLKIDYSCGPENSPTILIEGIGRKYCSDYSYTAEKPTQMLVPSNGEYDRVEKVFDNGELIFEYADFDAPSIAGTESVVYDATKANTAEWFDLSGVRLAEKPTTAGIYIVRYTDGTAKKIVVR